MKHFEAYLGDKWMAWDNKDTTSIKKSATKVVITTKIEDGPSLTQVIQLDKLPFYAFY